MLAQSGGRAAVGDHVSVRMQDSTSEVGIVKFIGPTEFAERVWVGVELEAPKGKNAGSIRGVTYFEGKANHCVFVRLSRISRIEERSSVRSSISSEASTICKSGVHDRSSISSEVSVKAIISGASTSSEASTIASLRSWTRDRSSISSDTSMLAGVRDGSSISSEASTAAPSGVRDGIEVGTRVLVKVKDCQEPGVVKFIGSIHLATGEFVGVDLDNPKGKSDGSLMGVFYFAGKAGHCVFSRRSRLTVLHADLELSDVDELSNIAADDISFKREVSEVSAHDTDRSGGEKTGECAKCHVQKSFSEFCLEQWENGPSRICERCRYGKLCAHCNTPRAKVEYTQEQWARGKHRVCKECSSPKGTPPSTNGYTMRSTAPAMQTTPSSSSSSPTNRTRRLSRVLRRHSSSDFVDTNYDFVRALGKGGFGCINVIRDPASGEMRVYKRVDTKGMESNTLIMMKKETELLSQLNHPHVVKVFEYSFDDRSEQLVSVLEYCCGGDCFDLLSAAEGEPLNESLVASILRQMLMALCYCHGEGVVHRDIKPDNIVLTVPTHRNDSSTSCKLIDFGEAAHGDIPKRGLYGTAPYTAPEVAAFANHRKQDTAQIPDYTPKADLWSLGVTTFEMLTDERPFLFNGNKMSTLKLVMAYRNFDGLKHSSQNLNIWGRSAEAKDFLSTLLTADSAKRPSAAEAVGHPWIKMHPDLQGL